MKPAWLDLVNNAEVDLREKYEILVDKEDWHEKSCRM